VPDFRDFVDLTYSNSGAFSDRLCWDVLDRYLAKPFEMGFYGRLFLAFKILTAFKSDTVAKSCNFEGYRIRLLTPHYKERST